MDSDDDKHVLKMRADVPRSERQCIGFLEDDGDNVVANVTFS